MELPHQISKKYSYGIGGWLLLIWVLLFLRVVESVFSEGLGRLLIYFFELRHITVLTLLSAGVISYRILEVTTICYLLFLIINQDHKALLFAKIYSILMYIHAFTIAWAFISAYSRPIALQVAQAAIIAIPLPLAFYMYLVKSKRVQNTFMFSGTKLPATIQCPFCLEKLQLEDSERIAKEAICPECNNHISQGCFAA